MISNSLTSAELYQHRNRWYHWKLRTDIAENSAWASISPRWVPMLPRRALISSHRMLSVWVFHNVLLVVHDVSQVVFNVSQCITMFNDASQCFTSVSRCFTMFNNNLWCLESCSTSNSGAADHLRDRDNAVGIGDNNAWIGDNVAGIDDNITGIGDDAAGIVDIAAKVIPC